MPTLKHNIRECPGAMTRTSHPGVIDIDGSDEESGILRDWLEESPPMLSFSDGDESHGAVGSITLNLPLDNGDYEVIWSLPMERLVEDFLNACAARGEAVEDEDRPLALRIARALRRVADQMEMVAKGARKRPL